MKKSIFTLVSLVLLSSFANASSSVESMARPVKFAMKESLQTSCESKLLKNDSLWRQVTNSYQERVDLCTIEVANAKFKTHFIVTIVSTRLLIEDVLVKIAGDKNLSAKERVKQTEIVVLEDSLLESIENLYDYPHEVKTNSGLEEFLLDYATTLTLHESYSRYMNGTARLPSP